MRDERSRMGGLYASLTDEQKAASFGLTARELEKIQRGYVMAKHGGARTGAGRKKGGRDAVEKDDIGRIADIARQNTGVAMDTLIEVAQGGQSESARVAAANAILDRGYGKAQQSIDISGELEISQIDDEDLLAELASMRKIIGK